MKIGLTYTGSNEKHENYVRWLQGRESIELIILAVEKNNLAEIENCDGLVLSGGIDIHPRFYGSNEMDYNNRPEDFEEARDEFEISVFRMAQKKGIPVLGICRGLQLVNCIMGGSLRQDLGDAGNLVHKADKKNEVQLDKAHGLQIENNTLLKEITKIDRGVVNSAHHQHIDKIGNGIKVNCISDNGEIEGVEWEHPTGKPFLLCIQWHPERMFKFQLQNSPLSKCIRDRFIDEIKKKSLSS